MTLADPVVEAGLTDAGLVEVMSTEHHGIRRLLDRLEREQSDRQAIAEQLCNALARHRASCTELVLQLAAEHQDDHEQQSRLLVAATRGIDQLVDRLRLPASDPQRTESLVEALRTLVLEHERLELELALAGVRTGE